MGNPGQGLCRRHTQQSKYGESHNSSSCKTGITLRSHTLILLVNDARRNADHLVETRKKVRKIGSYFHHSIKAANGFKEQQQKT